MACGSDNQSSGTTWTVGGQYEFSSYENAHSMQDLISEAYGEATSGPYVSEGTKDAVQADAIADAVAGYK